MQTETANRAAPKTRAEKLAGAILADNERGAAKTDMRDPFSECFSCGRGMTYRGSRFCSDRCRNWFDVGDAPFAEQQEQQKRIRDAPAPRVIAGPPGAALPYMPQPMRRGPVGFYIGCACCEKEFESKGLRCCSTECERRYREREDNLAVLAQVGMEPARKRQCAHCGAPIPTWRNGRKVSKATRFCSPKCSRKAVKAGTMESDIETMKKAA